MPNALLTKKAPLGTTRVLARPTASHFAYARDKLGLCVGELSANECELTERGITAYSSQSTLTRCHLPPRRGFNYSFTQHQPSTLPLRAATAGTDDGHGGNAMYHVTTIAGKPKGHFSVERQMC